MIIRKTLLTILAVIISNAASAELASKDMLNQLSKANNDWIVKTGIVNASTRATIMDIEYNQCKSFDRDIGQYTGCTVHNLTINQKNSNFASLEVNVLEYNYLHITKVTGKDETGSVISEAQFPNQGFNGELCAMGMGHSLILNDYNTSKVFCASGIMGS